MTPKKAGTGDDLGRIPLGELGDLVIKDDGANDTDVTFDLIVPTGDREYAYKALGIARRELGDDRVMQEISEQHPENDGGSGSTSYTRQVAFSCARCNRTWPGSKNQNPGPGDDVCPECAEDDS